MNKGEGGREYHDCYAKPFYDICNKKKDLVSEKLGQSMH